MLPIILTTGPLADFITGAVLGGAVFSFVAGSRNIFKLKK